jgi:hypothetical protein
MQELEPANKPFYGEARVFSLQSGKELDLLELELFMQETRDRIERNSDSAFGMEQTTVVVIEMKHFGDLPNGFADKVAQRAYDYAASQGVYMRGSDAKASVSGYALPVKQ